MQHFQFGLDTLLRIRRRQLDVAQQEFVRQQQIVIRYETESERLRAEQERQEATARAEEHEEVDVARARSYRDYVRRLACQRAEILERLAAAHRELEEKRQAWMEAQQTVKTLEALRERRYNEYLHEARREEQGWLDEAALAFRRALPKQ